VLLLKNSLLRLTNRALRPVGFKVVRRRASRKAADETGGVPPIAPDAAFEAAFFSLLTSRKSLNIVQVGANDGQWGDPLWNLVNSNPSRTNVLLCEPQPEIAQVLVENYSSHPSARVFPGAIGRPGTNMFLHRIKPEYWGSLHASYLKGAPDYCAPSGIASLDRQHVAKNLRLLKLREPEESFSDEEMIESIPVEVLTMDELLSRFPEVSPVDVLVIDVEGLDDEIITQSLSQSFLPLVVFFEIQHLSSERLDNLVQFLKGLGYFITQVRGNALAVHSGFRSS